MPLALLDLEGVPTTRAERRVLFTACSRCCIYGALQLIGAHGARAPADLGDLVAKTATSRQAGCTSCSGAAPDPTAAHIAIFATDEWCRTPKSGAAPLLTISSLLHDDAGARGLVRTPLFV